MEVLRNETYRKFILENVLRPYQNKIGIEQRIEEFTNDNYFKIIGWAQNNQDWWSSVLDRIRRIYSHIDISMFSDDRTARFIQSALYDAGVKFIGFNQDAD